MIQITLQITDKDYKTLMVLIILKYNKTIPLYVSGKTTYQFAKMKRQSVL